MRRQFIQRILGIFLLIFSLTLIPPMLVSIGYRDGELPPFAVSFALTLVLGILLWLPTRGLRGDLRRREGFMVVAMFWIMFSALGTLPLLFGARIGVANAIFEVVSGVTTTGATVLTGLDRMPQSLLYYRAQLQWFGGMGLIVFAVAILPMLGIGGMQLYRAETPGPMKDDKLAPRIASSARTLWYIYAGLTAACALGFWLTGMNWFDALTHSFATLSTGGFSTHDASMGYFHSPAIEAVADVFMLAGGINFSIHYIAFAKGQPRAYLRDLEVRTYFAVVAIVIALCTWVLLGNHVYHHFFTALRYAAFQAISIITCTGFTSTNFAVWPMFLPSLILIGSVIGGCAGSTSGGMKVIRFLVLFKQGLRDMGRLGHPRRVDSLKLSGRVVPERIVDAVWGFLAVYVATCAFMMLLLVADGMDQLSAFSAVVTCINNAGPGLGQVAANFQHISAEAKLILSATMLLGRLEIFTLLVLVSPSFWRK